MGGLNLYQVLLQLVLTPLYLRFLGVDGYGIVGFYLVLVGFAAVVDTAISGAVCREIAWLQAREGEKRQIPTLVFSTEVLFWWLAVLLSGLLLGAAFFSGENWFPDSARLGGQLRGIGWLMAGSFLVGFPAGFYNGILNGHQKQIHGGAIGAVAQSVRGFGAAALLGFVSPDLRIFFLWNILAGALQTAALRRAAWNCVNVAGVPSRFSWQAVESLREFAGALFVITVCSGVSLYADRLILSKWIPLADYGTYVVIATVLAGFSRLVTPLTLYFSPLMTTHASSGDRRATAICLRDFSGWVLLLLIPPLTNFSLFSDEILTWWTGKPELADGTASLALFLAAGFLLQSLCYPVTTMLYAEKKLAGLLQAAVVAAFLVPGCLLVIIPHHGSLGAAGTLAFSALAYFVYILVIGSRALGVSLLFLPRDLCLSVAVSLGLSLVGWALVAEIVGTPGPLSLGLLFILSFTGNAVLVLMLTQRAGKVLG